VTALSRSLLACANGARVVRGARVARERGPIQQ
jgi:hypothetical protein